ncbi:expressed unknown protein [Seminavis robusta]|uniref:Uncharacterized protein n=1 Tax=Seminavis robusta TaxID=568900 RepID=A0A9N8F0T4_9STRA|nr:expressed unknown protein [Seminavis robusta]|eukprot:Sro3706_g350531.1  (200) ;mRNA; f:1643-2242
MKSGRCVYSGSREFALGALEATSDTQLVNPGNLLMDQVNSLGFNHIEPEKSDTTDLSDGSSAGMMESAGDFEELAPFSHRFLACTMVTWLCLRDRTLLWMLFLFVPLATLFMSLYNVGPYTAPHEAIVMIVMLVSAPAGLVVQTTATSRFSALLPLVNMKRCGLYSGVEYSVQLLFFYTFLSLGMTLVVYTSSLLCWFG